MTGAVPEKHLVLEVEIPVMYVADIEGLRAEDQEFESESESESDFILNCIGEPSIVRLRCEISGEKDSDVVEVWGKVRSAKLAEPGRGYGDGPHLTDEQLEEHGGFKLLREKDACEWCQLYDVEAD